MVLAQRFLKVSGQAFLMDSDNILMFPSAMEFVLTHTFRNEEFNYTTFGFSNFTHPRRGSWTGEIKLSDSSFEPKFFVERTVGSYTSPTAGVAFVEMEEQTVAAGPQITLDYAPITDTIQVFGDATREDLTQGVAAADPNVYSIVGNIVTMPPSAVLGTEYHFNYWRNSSTCSRITWSPYDQPSAFTLYAAQAVVWATSGVKYWARVYAKSCVPTADIKMSGGDVTLAFNINNVVEDDFLMDLTPINE